MLRELLAGLAGGLKGYGSYMMYQDEQRRLDEAERLRREEAELRRQQTQQQMEHTNLQMQAMRRALEREPMEHARNTLDANLKIKGPESVFNDPATLDLAKTAGITLPTKPLPPPIDPSVSFSVPTKSGVLEVSGQDMRDMGLRREGVFPNTGIVKSPEVLQKEVERELEINRARAMQDILSGLGMQGGGGLSTSGMSPEQLNRLRLRMGLGINANEVFGPIRETPEEAAAVAKAQADARLPAQKELLEYAKKIAPQFTGDPYFNEFVGIVAGLIPPINDENINRIVQAAGAMARAAQRQYPRPATAPPAPAGGGTPTPQDAPPPPAPGANPFDPLIDQAVKQFGGWDQAITESSKPEVKARLKQLGIDPEAYLIRMRAKKINALMGGGR